MIKKNWDLTGTGYSFGGDAPEETRQRKPSDTIKQKRYNLLLSLAFLVCIPLAASFGDDDEPMPIFKRHTEQTEKKVEPAEPKEPKEQTLESKIAKTRKELDQLVASSGSCTEDRDCVALAIGEKPCGGPERYIVYSQKGPKSSEISKLAETYLTHRKAENSSSINMSDCEFVAAPRTECNSKKSCVATAN